MKFLRLVLLISSTSRPSKAHCCSTTSFVSSMVTTRRSLTTTTTKRAAKEASPSLPSKKPAKRKASSSSSSKKQTSSTTPDEAELSASAIEGKSPWYRFFTKGDEEYDRYMASEWGFEKRGDVPLFEKISLEGAQAGLSWLTILRKREAYRNTFHAFDIDKVAAMAQEDVEQIVAHTADDPRQMVVRHAGKIQAVIHNAKCIQMMRQNTNDGDGGDDVFDKLMWSFCNDQPIVNHWSGKKEDMQVKSPESEHMAKELKKRGFKFVGPTTCYAFMQSVGMVIDHPVGSNQYNATLERLQTRKGGYQER